MVVAEKKNKDLRICIDPQALNKSLKREHHPTPVIDDILPQLTKAKVFSSSDLANGYWHCVLDEKSSFLTTFQTPFGHYRWLRLPFGLNVSGEIFQKQLLLNLENLDGVVCIADDVIIYGVGETYEEAVKVHDSKIIKFLERCQAKGIKLNKSKAVLRKSEIAFLGYEITSKGLMPDPKKVEAILNMKPPTDVTGVKEFTVLEKFHEYVYGRKIIVESDHKPIASIVLKPLCNAPKRLQGMLLNILQYDVEIIHKKGKEMYVADALSRSYLPLDNYKESEFEQVNMLDYLPETLINHEIADRPWQKVGVDLMSIEKHNYLITVDYFSNFWEIDYLENTLASTVIRKLKSHFARYGLPCVLISDNGPQFVNENFKQFATDYDYEHRTSSPTHAQSNGMVESAVKTSKRLIRKAVESNKDPYLAILDHRNTPTSDKDASPSQYNLGRRTRTKLPMLSKLLENQNVNLELAKAWEKGKVVERLDERSYLIESEGKLFRRNRVQLKETPSDVHMPKVNEPVTIDIIGNEIETPVKVENKVESDRQTRSTRNKLPSKYSHYEMY
ncbi:uncharacterized protein K02A2.6-like [Macrobrachium nipponense]|uniref:uncharacterized protein K02A2.6-like n=1 Tax=Macrobrachium nipponense TaxID=159736 RepID=UPI0030C7D0AC